MAQPMTSGTILPLVAPPRWQEVNPSTEPGTVLLEASSQGLEGKEARFAIYSALSNQILNVEKTIERDDPKFVLVYPDALLEYIRKIHGEVGDEQTDTESDDEDVLPLYQLSDVGPLLSTNGAVEWARFPADSGKPREVNQMTGAGGVIPHARSQVSDMIESFNLFLTPAINDTIIRFTNVEGTERYGNGWAVLDTVELDAYLGILLLQGVYHDGTLYFGKLVGGKAEKNQGQRVVLDLGEYLGNNSGRNVTTDNLFTSLSLGETLLKKKISLERISQIPSAFLPSKNREVLPSLFGHTSDVTLVSYVPKKSKAVILLGSMHRDAEIDEQSKEEKPEIVAEYNRTKAGVDPLDQLTATAPATIDGGKPSLRHQKVYSLRGTK
ncbi:hypothetical protein RvY_01828 [Ramazzottius varieornatus]|uniref:PiggyBac transposable element-derived protein domain-containing protein n=1 Tax=Ramazzottius varieornatus TaxID=947166 RepID=A0A1D1USV2_RAMVA|nr:hypothetical protein RvY_01828 [Ramazzottius varieornatus]